MPSLSTLLKLGVAGAALAAPAVAEAQAYRFHYDHVLGTSLDLTAVATDRASALMAATAARREIARLDALLSDWRADAELARLNAFGEVQASPDLKAVLARCEHWRGVTGGAFDCRVGGALQLWRAAEVEGLGAPALGAAVKVAEGDLVWRDDAVARPAGVRLTLDGIAKGYVIDAAMHAAREASPGLAGLMVDIGGDLRCWGAPGAERAWRVGVAGSDLADNAQPSEVLRLGDRAVAFSGRGARDLHVQGCAVSSTLSPSTGLPVEGVRNAVVLADSAMDADALATAFMVMAPHQAMALADRLDRVEAMVTASDGTRYTSSGWAAHVEPGAGVVNASLALPATAAAAASAAQAPAGLELTYEVPRIDADPYHAPYLVAWITDADHKLVRTLLVLGQKPRWAPENYVWWRRYGRETPGVLDTVAKPTRMPGRYTARWDGRDDAGRPLAPGRYILHIEASREKGGHTYETADVQLRGAGVNISLPAKDELGAVTLRGGPAA